MQSNSQSSAQSFDSTSTSTDPSNQKTDVVVTITHLNGQRTIFNVDETDLQTFRDIFTRYSLQPQQFTIRAGPKEYTDLDTKLKDLPKPKVYKGVQMKKRITIEEKVVGGDIK